jgi:hypothetical protein
MIGNNSYVQTQVVWTCDRCHGVTILNDDERSIDRFGGMPPESDVFTASQGEAIYLCGMCCRAFETFLGVEHRESSKKGGVAVAPDESAVLSDN